MHAFLLTQEQSVDVLVTGAGGRVGSHLAALARRRPHRPGLRGLADDPSIARVGEAGAEPYYGDLEIPEDLVAAVTGVDAVCHLAAALTTHDVSDDRFVDVNLRGTFNLLEAVREHAPQTKRFVYTSSDAVYLSMDEEDGCGKVIDESYPQRPGTVYGATKVGAEMLSRAYWKSYGIPCTVMRPTATANPEEFVRPSSVFGRRWFVKAAIAWYETHSNLGPAARRAGRTAQRRRRSREAVRADRSGRRHRHRDVRRCPRRCRGMRAMLEADAAIGEAFNIGPAAPCSEGNFVEHLGVRLGLKVVEIRQERPRRHWRVSSDKGRQMLGYQPAHDPLGMIHEAVAQMPGHRRLT